VASYTCVDDPCYLEGLLPFHHLCEREKLSRVGDATRVKDVRALRGC
jgi:hypothetical protein